MCGKQAPTASKPSSVRALPQPSHVIFSADLKRTRSALSRTCFVDIRHDTRTRTIRERL